jgi:hypothetical protein
MFVYYSYPYELAVNVEESPTCSSIILYLYEVIIVATSPDRKRFTSLAHTQKFRKIDQYPAPPPIFCAVDMELLEGLGPSLKKELLPLFRTFEVKRPNETASLLPRKFVFSRSLVVVIRASNFFMV